MHLVIAGDCEEKVAAREHELLTNWRTSGKSVRTLDLVTVGPADLETALGTVGLLGTRSSWRILGLELLRSPKQQERALALLHTTDDDVVVVMRKALTPALRKRFDKAWKLEEHKTPTSLFVLGEHCGAVALDRFLAELHAAVAERGEWAVHALLARHFQQLLRAKVGLPLAAAPFVQIKLQKQSARWHEERLRDFLHMLFATENVIKSGKTKQSWSTFVDIWLAKHYDSLHLPPEGGYVPNRLQY